MSKPQSILIFALFAVAACGGSQATMPEPESTLQPFAEFDRMPAGVAVHEERVFLSFPRWVEAGDYTVAELVDGQLVPYPSADSNAIEQGADALISVNGLHMDSRGWLWILDNARVDLAPAMEDGPKLVVWDTVNEREVFRHVFSPDVAPPAASFLNDIAVDEDNGFAYISESGIGGTPCLISFEIHRDIATRLLEGHVSVIPDPERTMVINGEPVMLHRPDGPTPWRVSVNTIGLAPGSAFLTYGPMTSDQLYRVPTLALRDAQLSSEDRAAAVEAWGPKPMSDGMGYAPDGAVFITDVEGSRIATTDQETSTIIADPRFTFPVAIEATETDLWFTTNQLHLMPILLAGEDRREPPYFLWRVAREALAH